MNEDAPGVEPDGQPLDDRRGIVSDAETVSQHDPEDGDEQVNNHNQNPHQGDNEGGDADDHIDFDQGRDQNQEIHDNTLDPDDGEVPDVRMLQAQQPQYLPQEQQQQQQPPQAILSYPPPSWQMPGGSPHHPSGIPQPYQQHQPPPPPQHPGLLHYYEARMRDHAAAYASAAAGAAWAAAQIAANVGSPTHQSPVPMVLPSPMFPPMPPPHNMAYGANPSLPPQQPQPFYDAGIQQHSPDTMPQHHATTAATATSPYYYYASPAGGNHQSPPHQYGDESNHYVGSHNSINNNLLEDSASTESMHYNHHRRKRQQRMSPSETHQKYQRPTQQRIGHATASTLTQQQQQQQHNSRLGSPNHATNHNNNNNHSVQSPSSSGGGGAAAEKRGRRRRRFRNDIGGSSGGDTDPNSSSYNNNNNNSRRHKSARMKPFASSSSDGGGGANSGANMGTNGGGGIGGGTNQYHHHKKKQRQPSDESLLGKTGISALYEWCGKRRTKPTFSWLLHEEGDEESTTASTAVAGTALGNNNINHEDFEMTVTVDGMECGRGKGRTKSAAKQEAARRALQLLLPGVVFDEASGFLVELPPSSSYQQPNQWVHHRQNQASSDQQNEEEEEEEEEEHQLAATCALEELAPNLAKRLAIGPNNNDDLGKPSKTFRLGVDSSKKRHKPSQKLPHVYPETSTTSEEEDKNAYFASRGASVCSALLHAMVQIDERIPEAPIYTYEVSTVPSNAVSTANNSQLKRKGGPASSTSSYAPASTIVIHRGSFTCTASMKLKQSESSEAVMPEESEEPGILRDDKGEQILEMETLRAIGVGGTKREARHIASARLLALLFPECDGMVQVKQAAEAAREQYAASKAMKQRSQRERAFTDAVTTNRRSTNDDNLSESPLGQKNISFAMASTSDPPLPHEIAQHFRWLLGGSKLHKKVDLANDQKDPECDRQTMEGVEDSTITRREKEEGCLARQLSRQKQLDDKVAATLQKLNEHDEEGRSRPDELTVDDVGRTVLRRAGPEDVGWIVKLLGDAAGVKQCDFQPSALSPVSVIVPTEDDNCSQSGKDDLHLWSSSTIVLLLCRAIAPFEDPPLGCAVLTLGFSMEKGRLLRIAQVASEPHLPRERFIECLQSFACCMGYTLETATKSSMKDEATSLCCLRTEDQGAIVDSFLSRLVDPPTKLKKAPSAKGVKDSPRDFGEIVGGQISVPLQSVQEESEEENQSDANLESLAEKRNAKKVQDKPSKRSRVN